MATNKKLNKITVLNQSKKSSDLPVQQNRILEKVVDETVSISKPTGAYINIAKILNLNNEEFNGYKSSIRDLIEAYIDVETSWEKQERRAILKIIEKFKGNNSHFPKTTGDWAIKELFRRSMNNKRAHQKRLKKKEMEVILKKNKSVITRDKIKNKVVISSSGTADDLSDKSDNNDNNTDVDNTNTNVSGKSGKKKNERKKSGRISNQPRKDYNENNKVSYLI
ncbi:hypothetical protein GLOIN_2v741902 [Rhizophagus irregularis DAOM 181602=DAOM 197198]|uniref:Uncharacterized protein n=1 Tax=Rhizophagus irregularis (strain DAOM 197198w) TaxID=1432141 RepID=A0A015M0A4_RHIIW|nr:hypothetical protein RirG_180760 [Rhizophagus irregularis DAOM 197198w]GET64287.1 hypothetical protein GLOIN_2v741902 [Rhizophagus irregularis DAOM 181602=DAOM 197198]